MFKYTLSAINDTFDFAKRFIYIFQIFIQLFYITFLTYRLIGGLGNLFGNIALLTVSTAYFLYQIITTREFYTERLASQKVIVRRIAKAIKYAVNVFIILLAVISLAGSTENDNVTLLITVMMMFGVLASGVFDVILLLIDKQAALIKASVKYDIEIIKNRHEAKTTMLKLIGLDLEKEFPKFDNEKQIKRVKDANYRQEQKQIRKRDFKNKNR